MHFRQTSLRTGNCRRQTEEFGDPAEQTMQSSHVISFTKTHLIQLTFIHENEALDDTHDTFSGWYINILVTNANISARRLRNTNDQTQQQSSREYAVNERRTQLKKRSHAVSVNYVRIIISAAGSKRTQLSFLLRERIRTSRERNPSFKPSHGLRNVIKTRHVNARRGAVQIHSQL